MLKITRLKLIVQFISFLVIAYLGYLGVQIISWGKVPLTLPTLSCYYSNHRIASCFLRSLQEGLALGWKDHYLNLLIPIILFAVLGLIVGRAWCSWVCPLGFLQDLFIKARKYLKLGYYNLTEALKQTSFGVKWFFVFGLFFVAAGIGIPGFFLKAYQYDLVTPFCQICPSKQIFPFLTGRFREMLVVDDISTLTAVMSYLAIGVFAFYLVTTSFIRRLWCRLCPMGAMLGLMNKLSFLSVRKEGKRCTKCGICQRSCPMQIEEVYKEKEKERVTTTDCILCFRCVEMCPEKEALKVGLFKFSIAVSKYKRFLKSSAVRVTKGKRSIPSEQHQRG